MKKEVAKWIAVAIVFIYAVSVFERMIWNNTTEKQNEAYKQEKEQYENDIQELELKLYEHEINLIKKNAAVDSYSDDQLDSAWTAIFD